jgi:hypothetical protein
MSANLIRSAQLSDVAMLATLMIEVYAEADFAMSHEAAQRRRPSRVRCLKVDTTD